MLPPTSPLPLPLLADLTKLTRVTFGADCFPQLSPAPIRRLAKIIPEQTEAVVRLDFRSDLVLYLNDIEEDAEYARWPVGLNQVGV